MNRMIRITVLALMACALAAPSHAGPVIDWDPAYFYSTTAGVTATNAPLGSNMFIVGTVSVFGPPLNFLNASDPTKDYTFYIHGMTSNGTVATPVPSLGTAYVTTYTTGTIELYEGTPRDAAFDPNPPNANVPSTFTNGTLLLSGTFFNFYTQTNNFSNFSTGNAEANISWTGGTLLPFMSPGGQPCPSLFTGGLSWQAGVVIPGYVFRHDGKIDLECPTPARPSTWGKIKALYR
jgi:hypothetical protein